MQRSSSDSTAYARPSTLRRGCTVLVACASLTFAAMAGAWAHAYFNVPPVLSIDQQRLISQQAARDSAYIRENVSVLTNRVGDLQARVIAMDSLSKRVALAAGVVYTDPEIQASLEQPQSVVMDYLTPEDNTDWTAEGVGRQLDNLQQQLQAQQEGLTMLDLVMTRRAGLEASLPTYTPVNYPWLSSSYGWRRNPVTGRHAMHEGLDFAAPRGTPIYAASGGVVAQARAVSGYGKMVEIDHGNGLMTRYAHASSLHVKTGDVVEKGQMVAKVGSTGRSTGSHLHFEVRMAGHPLDPTLFLAKPEASGQLVAGATLPELTTEPQVR
ncbi:M23 family metallopeptidase [Alcaligenaceae bacterium]|nr:M23 family metallopeptidase [Alcaligenaceae bacterium]